MDGDSFAFKLYFGIDLEKAKVLSEKSNSIQVACFLGHAGWFQQLDDELSEDAWLVSNLDYKLFSKMKQKKKSGGKQLDQLVMSLNYLQIVQTIHSLIDHI